MFVSILSYWILAIFPSASCVCLLLLGALHRQMRHIKRRPPAAHLPKPPWINGEREGEGGKRPLRERGGSYSEILKSSRLASVGGQKIVRLDQIPKHDDSEHFLQESETSLVGYFISSYTLDEISTQIHAGSSLRLQHRNARHLMINEKRAVISVNPSRPLPPFSAFLDR